MTTKKRKLWCPVCSQQWEPTLVEDESMVECPDCGYMVPIPWEPEADWPYAED